MSLLSVGLTIYFLLHCLLMSGAFTTFRISHVSALSRNQKVKAFESNFMLNANVANDDAEQTSMKVTFATRSILLWSILVPTDVMAASEDLSALAIFRPTFEIFVNTMCVFFLCRTVLFWYPKTDLKKFPYNVAVWPTEPLLEPVRSLVPPAFGVDVSALVWIALLSFFREILTGQQGILTLFERG